MAATYYKHKASRTYAIFQNRKYISCIWKHYILERFILKISKISFVCFYHIKNWAPKLASPKSIIVECKAKVHHVNWDWDLASDKDTRLGKTKTTIAPHKAPEYRIIFPMLGQYMAKHTQMLNTTEFMI